MGNNSDGEIEFGSFGGAEDGEHKCTRYISDKLNNKTVLFDIVHVKLKVLIHHIRTLL